MDVSPRQLLSVAANLIPFLEHDDAKRTLMGANMQRQAVPLIKAHAPFVGTGMEERAALDSGELIRAAHAGTVTEVDAAHVVVYSDEYGSERYDLPKYERSNQSTCINHRPIVPRGREGRGGPAARRRHLDRPLRARPRRQPHRGLHAVGGLQLRGRHHRLRACRAGGPAHVGEHLPPRDRRPATPSSAPRRSPARSPTSPRTCSPTSTMTASSASAPRSAPATSSWARSRPRARRPSRPRSACSAPSSAPRPTTCATPPSRCRTAPTARVVDVVRFSREGRRRPPAGRQRARPRLRRAAPQDPAGRQDRRSPRQQGRRLQRPARGGHALHGRRHARRRPARPAGRPPRV